MDNSLVISNNLAVMPVMALEQAKTRRDALVEFTRSIMVSNTDYGVIPGTGDKATLLKPGAEKLCSFFGLSPQFELVESVKDWTGNDHNGEPFFYFEYRCTLTRDGMVVGQGNGNCNSWEKKYRYRTVFANRATADDKERGRLETRNGRNGSYQVYVVPHPDPADLVNTLSKMAQKRALVAATLIAVNASEFFTQDIEDMSANNDFVDGAWFDSDTPQEQPKPVKKDKPMKPTWKQNGNGNTTDSEAVTPDEYKQAAYASASLKDMAQNVVGAKVGYDAIPHVINAMTETYANEVLGGEQFFYKREHNKAYVDWLIERKA